ncbi:MAG: RNA polymerase sigma factor [Bacteroidia bacterium]|nr:RNA polymerase sigma factor [Bacteroidia bacterium]
MTVNNCLNQIEKNKRRWLFGQASKEREDITEVFGSSREETPEQKMIDAETAKKVRDAIDSLPQKQKTAFILQRYQELSQQEIAQIMGITEGAVEQLLQRGKMNLKKKLSL